MAAPSSALLPPAWSLMLEQIETALTGALSQVSEPASEKPISRFVPAPAASDRADRWAKAMETAEASASAAEAELARTERMLRDWLEAVQASRVRLEAVPDPRIR